MHQDDRYMMELNSANALQRHMDVGHNGTMQVHCPICISLVVNGAIVIPAGEKSGYMVGSWAEGNHRDKRKVGS
jgi:hypothetical protein